jgi:chemotaxis protein histidine kinase CheA
MKEMLTQLMRNAVYYGIETPAERLSCGKDKVGLIGLSITLRNDTLYIKLGDDGHGLDFDSIRATAFAHGLLRSGRHYSESQLAKLIFEPTFSTAEATDLYAGRGIGLNLVRDRVIELHGSIKVRTALGKGTVFNLSIPVEAPPLKSV